MGNESGKEKQNEQEIKRTFQNLSKNHVKIEKGQLQSQWEQYLDEYASHILINYLCPPNEPLTYKKFKNAYDQLLSNVFDEKCQMLSSMISNSGPPISHTNLQMFLESFIKSFFLILCNEPNSSAKSWNVPSTLKVDQYAEYLIRSQTDIHDNYNDNELRAIYSYFNDIFVYVMCTLFEVPKSESLPLFPKWIKTHKTHAYRSLETFSVLTLTDIYFLNSELPMECQAEWNLLFCTKIHGESFSRFSSQIMNQGPTLVIIKEKTGCIFGAFAPENWCFGPKFVGDASSFTFILAPEMHLFPASNFNNNFQYMNQGQQTMPNGLGFGGRLEYFGIWLDYEFGKGVYNASCTTYRNFKSLLKEKEFEISNLEVWAVGKPPPSAEELGERKHKSILDANAEVRAMLEMAGRKAHSEGLRDVDEEDQQSN